MASVERTSHNSFLKIETREISHSGRNTEYFGTEQEYVYFWETKEQAIFHSGFSVDYFSALKSISVLSLQRGYSWLVFSLNWKCEAVTSTFCFH